MCVCVCGVVYVCVSNVGVPAVCPDGGMCVSEPASAGSI